MRKWTYILPAFLWLWLAKIFHDKKDMVEVNIVIKKGLKKYHIDKAYIEYVDNNHIFLKIISRKDTE